MTLKQTLIDVAKAAIMFDLRRSDYKLSVCVADENGIVVCQKDTIIENVTERGIKKLTDKIEEFKP